MSRLVHFRIDGDSKTISRPTACGGLGFNTPDTDLITCPNCRGSDLYRLSALRHREVVEALAYPKEDHPCLKSNRP